MNTLYFNAFSQRLVLSAVFQNNRVIGKIDLTGQTGKVELFYTISSVTLSNLFYPFSYFLTIFRFE
jgi:hypothetical protein